MPILVAVHTPLRAIGVRVRRIVGSLISKAILGLIMSLIKAAIGDDGDSQSSAKDRKQDQSVLRSCLRYP